MSVILVRTLLVYVFLILTIRLMGKRQIGELEVTDLVSTLLLSEIASLPITDPNIPVSHALIPMVTLLSLEVLSSFILLRVPKLKKLLSAAPTVIINDGVLNPTALLETRVSMDELMSEIRQKGLSSFGDVEYAILEKNGKLTILPKSAAAPPSASQLGLNLPSTPLMHIVYSSGKISDVGLALIGKNRKWLERAMQRRNIDTDRLFCLTANKKGELYEIYRKEGES